MAPVSCFYALEGASEDDSRLGAVHGVLLSHAHGDHIGDQKMKALEAGTCDAPEVVSAAPDSMVKGRPVYPALSGKTMEFDGAARCVSGC